MKRYRTTKVPEGARLVHNLFPGPSDDPGRCRAFGADGFRYWVTDEPDAMGNRCYCGWLDGREHNGTVHWINEKGEPQSLR